jgi:four helix bundle protein
MDKWQLKNRTQKFAHDCVKLLLGFPNGKLGSPIQGQLIGCSTSVAANYRAVCVAQSINSFISKLGIVIVEIDEANCWIEFAKEDGIISDLTYADSLIKESGELTSVFISSRRTAQNNQ